MSETTSNPVADSLATAPEAIPASDPAPVEPVGAQNAPGTPTGPVEVKAEQDIEAVKKAAEDAVAKVAAKAKKAAPAASDQIDAAVAEADKLIEQGDAAADGLLHRAEAEIGVIVHDTERLAKEAISWTVQTGKRFGL